MKKRDGRHPRGVETVPLELVVPAFGTVSWGVGVGFAFALVRTKRRAAPLGRRSGPLLASYYGGLVCESMNPLSPATKGNSMPGRKAVKADFDALAFAYQLLNVHRHLLDVDDDVAPHGIQGAGFV